MGIYVFLRGRCVPCGPSRANVIHPLLTREVRRRLALEFLDAPSARSLFNAVKQLVTNSELCLCL